MGSPSISPFSTMVDWSDSHYQYVKKRIKAVNPFRLFGGIVEAQDWPLKEAQIGAFYMLTTTLEPTRPSDGPGSNSWSSSLYGERIQWAWQIIGDDIASNALASNRGNRYRLNGKMIQELLHGHYPGFGEKQQWTMDNTGLLQATSYVPKEMLWWTKPRFSDRIDKASGILFGSALTIISGFSPSIIS